MRGRGIQHSVRFAWQAQRVAERVIPLELGVVWDPNAPEAALVSNDVGPSLLMLRPRADDTDQRRIALVWEGARAAVMQPPNDEAISGHRLYNKGLKGVLWAAEVLDSEWISDLERRNRVHSLHDPQRFSELRHFVLLLKECTVEVVAPAVVVRRVEAGSVLAGAAEALP